MSVLLEIRLPLSLLPVLRNSEDIENCLEGLLVDYDSSVAAAAINDITKAVLASVKALPCEIITRDEAGSRPSFTNGSASSSTACQSNVAPRSRASASSQDSDVPNREYVPWYSPHDGWGACSWGSSAATENSDGKSICHCYDPKNHCLFFINVGDAPLRSKRFQVNNCSTVRELAALSAGPFQTSSDPQAYAWSVYVKGLFQGYLANDQFDQSLSLIVENNTTFVLSPARNIDITVCDAMGRQKCYNLCDTEPFRRFQESWFQDAQIGNVEVQFQVDGNMLDDSKTAGKSLRELGFYDNIKVYAALRSQFNAQRILIHITDGKRLKCILDLSKYGTLDDMSRAYRGRLKHAPANVSFVFAGNRLNGSSVTLQEFGISDGATVMVIHGPSNGVTDYNIVFKDAMNVRHILNFHVTDTYLDLIDRFANVIGLPTQSLSLEHNGVTLGADVTAPLPELGLYDNAVIHVIRKPAHSRFAKTSSIKGSFNPVRIASSTDQSRVSNNSFVRGSVSADDVWAASHASEADDWE